MGDAQKAMPQWIWWAGHRSSVDDDCTYDIDSGATKDAVVAAALRDTMPGDQFYVIEAIMHPWKDDGDVDSRWPFAETRNRELLTNGPIACLPPAGSRDRGALKQASATSVGRQ